MLPEPAEPQDEAAAINRRRKRNERFCDLLLARLFQFHPDHALVALKGIEPASVIDLEPRELPPEPKSALVIPFPIQGNISPPLRPSLRTIFGCACAFYEVEHADLFSHRQCGTPLRARQVSIYLACIMTVKSLSDIGRFIDRDHSTVLHSRRKIENRMKFDARLRDEIDVLKLHIKQEMLNAATPPAIPAISQPALDTNAEGNAAH